MSHTQDVSVPVIAIDGGAGTGKGSARAIVARELGWNELDSGLLYRSVGLLSGEKAVAAQEDIIHLALNLDLRVVGEVCFLHGIDRTQELRSDIAGKFASEVGQIAEVRRALHAFQLMTRRSPGLVADGRDQGAIFEQSYRYFLTADPRVKAERRMLQLGELGISFNPDDVYAEIVRRDHADTHREVSPLVPHPDAVVINTSYMTRDGVARYILQDYQTKRDV